MFLSTQPQPAFQFCKSFFGGGCTPGFNPTPAPPSLGHFSMNCLSDSLLISWDSHWRMVINGWLEKGLFFQLLFSYFVIYYRCVIHFELFFVEDVRSLSTCICLHLHVQLVQQYLLKWLFAPFYCLLFLVRDLLTVFMWSVSGICCVSLIYLFVILHTILITGIALHL